jgi:glycosyltransferase involved in cell wall biosynthesis
LSKSENRGASLAEKLSEGFMGIDPKKISVVIPAYNESAAIASVVGGMIRRLPGCEVIVVNDGSADETPQLAAGAGAAVVSHDLRLGYGASIKTGVMAAKREYVLLCDGDGQHAPEDAARLAEKGEGYDMVVGARDKSSHSPFLRRPGKAVLAVFADALAGRKIPDFNSGLRIFKKDVLLRYLHLMPNGFSFSLTSTLTMIKSNKRVLYVPIKVAVRKGKSMVVQLKDGPNILLLMIRLVVLFEPLKVFLPIAGALLLLACVSTGLDFMAARAVQFGKITIMLFLSSLIVFTFGLLCDQVSAIRREKHE